MAIRETFENIAPYLKAGAVVAGRGSTKSLVMSWAKELLPNTVGFVGTHPMAGKAMSIEGAEAVLFKGATWCVCPDPTAGEDAIRNILGMITALEGEPYFIDPLEHDAYVAGISHPIRPFSGPGKHGRADPSWRDMRTLTASGFRDMSRWPVAVPICTATSLSRIRTRFCAGLMASAASCRIFEEESWR